MVCFIEAQIDFAPEGFTREGHSELTITPTFEADGKFRSVMIHDECGSHISLEDWQQVAGLIQALEWTLNKGSAQRIAGVPAGSEAA